MAISEFQLALIGVGATAVAGVWACNSWQEYRQRKAADRVFRGTQEDVLVDATTDANEDAIDDVEVPAFARAELRSGDRIEPRIEPAIVPPRHAMEEETTVIDEAPVEPVAAAKAERETAVDVPEQILDPMIEAAMAFPPAHSIASLQESWCRVGSGFRKRIRWVGRGGDGEWADLSDPSHRSADHVHVAIQLADRQGAIDRNELDAFCRAVQAVSGEAGDQVAGLDELIAHARAMDDLCASVDIQIAIHIVGRAGQSFVGTKLRGLLEASGLQLASDGLFYLLDDEGRRLLSVCNSGAVPFDLEQMRTGSTADVTFWLDVPRVADGDAVFDTMLATARQLAEALDGVLVDDQRNPLTDDALGVIRAKIIELQTQMAAHGIPAGGRRALRLFA